MRDADRLVLLGDVLELRERPWRQVLAAADAALAAIGEALPRDGSIVLAVGNHDHGLLTPWLARRAVAEPRAGAAGGASRAGARMAGEPLERVCAALGGDRVTVSYPGVWLRDDVYAIHGHYLDRHTTVPTLERLGIGAVVRMARSSARRAGRRRRL